MSRKTTTTPTGAAIRYGRDLLGLTREELVDGLGGDWTVTKLTNYELGRTAPSLPQAVQLAEVLRLPLRVIAYGIDGPTTEGANVNPGYVSDTFGPNPADLLTCDDDLLVGAAR